MQSPIKNIKQLLIPYHIIITIIFVYIFVQFLIMKRSNTIYRFYTDYIMNKYCLILYIIIVLFIMKYDNFTAILLFILVLIPFKFAFKEYFIEYFDTPSTTAFINTTSIGSNGSNGSDSSDSSDTRFKIDDVAKNQILKQIKSQVDFDPSKTQLSKDVIYDIYNKYFDNNIFIKLKNVNDDSKNYIASGNFNYVPKNNNIDYDLVNFQNLTHSNQIGINPVLDDIKNRTTNIIS